MSFPIFRLVPLLVPNLRGFRVPEWTGLPVQKQNLVQSTLRCRLPPAGTASSVWSVSVSEHTGKQCQWRQQLCFFLQPVARSAAPPPPWCVSPDIQLAPGGTNERCFSTLPAEYVAPCCGCSQLACLLLCISLPELPLSPGNSVCPQTEPGSCRMSLEEVLQMSERAGQEVTGRLHRTWKQDLQASLPHMVSSPATLPLQGEWDPTELLGGFPTQAKQDCSDCIPFGDYDSQTPAFALENTLSAHIWGIVISRSQCGVTRSTPCQANLISFWDWLTPQ